MPSCPSCASALAPGQRYCLACGERAVGLPGHVAAMLGIPTDPAPGEASFEPPPGPGEPRPRLTTLSAPAAAVAVMAILGFGVIVGSVVSPPAESAQAPAIVAVSPPVTAPAPVVAPAAPAPAAPAPAAAPPAPVQQTVTQTLPAPAPPPPPVTPAPSGPQLPAVKHVWMVVLAGQGYDKNFGPNSQTPYLAGTLVKQGELVSNYYGVTGGALANEIALVSGQGPNPDTEAGCPDYKDFQAGPDSTDPQQKGQAIGTGCVYPRSTQTIGDELVASGYTWKSYVQDPPPASTRQEPATTDTTTTATTTTDTTTATSPPPPAPTACGHPVTTPFAYFHSVTDLSTCDTSIVAMDQLTTDLATATSTPTLSYVDGPADPAATDGFLKDVIPKITGSAAYKDGGLIAITFAAAPQQGDDADASACCAEPTYPNMPPPSAPPPADPSKPAKPLPPGADTATGGGGHVGLLLITRFVKPGSTAVSAYNHFSLLRSIEDLFGLQPTGYAGYPGVLAFDSVIYNRPATSS